MRRKGALKRGRWLSLLAAGLVGYVAGNWHAIALRTVELTASQSIALRFPEADAESTPGDAEPQAPARATNAIVIGDTSAALLSPAPMIVSAVRQAPAPQAPAQPAPAQSAQAQPAAAPPVRVASIDAMAPVAAAGPVFGPRMAAAPMQMLPVAKSETKSETKAETKPEPKIVAKLDPDAKIAIKPDAKAEAKLEAKAADTKADVKVAAIAPKPAGETAHPAKKTYVLNDAQIAQIRSRLHLSPDQEQMWPAVEAALRTIAYSRSRGHRGGATSADVAALDPYGPEVQGLKSAAFPLVMSFSDEQRSEVRSIVHVMGLDQLASQL